MKAIIEFNLPEENPEFTLFTNAGVLSSAISDLDNRMRSELKHGNTFKTVDEVCEYVRHELLDALNIIY